jgi:uncharacterized membrane protein
MVVSDFDILHKMRERARQRRAKPPGEPAALTWGERAADLVAATMGSWRFIVIQSLLLAVWLMWNSGGGAKFDPYPFILLNLALSFQAAYAAPIIMMSQNRQSDIDRRRAIEDFDINRKAELEIETLHQKIDLMREQEIAQLATAVARLAALLEKQS